MCQPACIASTWDKCESGWYSILRWELLSAHWLMAALKYSTSKRQKSHWFSFSWHTCNSPLLKHIEGDWTWPWTKAQTTENSQDKFTFATCLAFKPGVYDSSSVQLRVGLALDKPVLTHCPAALPQLQSGFSILTCHSSFLRSESQVHGSSYRMEGNMQETLILAHTEKFALLQHFAYTGWHICVCINK